nr:PREDICTED: vam6/Vps39-like protein [Bemisia tabaci]
MYDVYEKHHLLKSNSSIEALAAYDDVLYVGTSKGNLAKYNINIKYEDGKMKVESSHLCCYYKNFSKKPIQQLDVIPHYNILISLSDNLVSVHDTNKTNFPLLHDLSKTKGATLFTLHLKEFTSMTGKTAIYVRMCVAVKRKLLFYYWKKGEFLELREDIVLPDVPRALAWCADSICVGFKNDYVLYQLHHEPEAGSEENTNSPKKKDLFPVGKQPEPSITPLNDDSFIVGKDFGSVIIDTKGNVAVEHAVKWSQTPSSLANDDPYLLAVLNETVEVRSVEPALLVQTIPFAKPKLICRCKRGLTYVASSEQVWCLVWNPISKQIQLLLEEKQFQLALKLSNFSDETSEDKKNIHLIQTLYAFDLFNNKQFRESMQEFLKLGTDPYDVIRLFPNLLPQQVQDQDLSTSQTPDLELNDKHLENGLLALIEYLTEVRWKLAGTETQNIQLFQIIDTTLLKCYLQTNDALVEPLLRRNYCHLTETEYTLKKYNKFSELIILYQTKGLHSKALEYLQELADEPDSPLFGCEKTVNYLQHLGKNEMDLIFQFADWVLQKYPEEGLKIFTEDIEEVEQLPRPRVLDYLLKNHKSLVIQYLEHVIHVWKDTNGIFHNALVHQYREKIQQLSVPKATYAEQQAAQNFKTKLFKFLEESDSYGPETVLIHFPHDSMFEERCIILGKLGRHEQVLSIYLNNLGDIQRAIRYCDKVYKANVEGRDQVYFLLIKLLINPPDIYFGGSSHTTPPQPDLETALTILESNAGKIDALKVLSILPDDIQMTKIKHFLTLSLSKQLDERRRAQVLKGLVYAEHLQVHELRMFYESQSFLITEFNVCPVCKKRFTNQSAFVRYPNGDVVHYSCQEQVT